MRDQLVGGRYRLVRELGEGGMGQVWEARDETLGRPVAVKLVSLLAGGGSRGDQARARFLREARITARLQHPHIVTMHDLGEADTDGDRVPFLVMELVRGEGLDAKLARRAVTLGEAARWGAQICDALADAHANGIMHRDVKPSNIFITPSGSVKVLDFGIARAADGSVTADRLTRTGLIVGTPQYMAPEQARGMPEPRSDLYALGCLLFELLTGRLPFEAPDSMGYLSAHLTQEAPAPSAIRAGIPDDWDELVRSLLHKEPRRRYGDAAALARILRRLDTASESGGSAHSRGFPPPTEPDLSAAPAPGEFLFATSLGTSGTVRLWDPATGRPVTQPLAGHTGSAFRMAFSPDGRLLATGSTDETARLWDTASGLLVCEPLTGHSGTVEDVAFSPDGRLLATSGLDATVRLWDTATGEPVGDPLTGHTNCVAGVDFSPDGRLLATSSVDGTVRLWDPVTGEPLGEPMTGHTDAVLRLAFSPDGRLIATCSRDWTVRLWDPATGQAVGTPLTGHTNVTWEAAFSADGSLVAANSEDDTTLVWDTATGQLARPPFTAPANGGMAVAGSSDGPLLAVEISEEGTVRLLDAATGRPFGEPLNTHTTGSMYFQLSPRLRHRTH